MVTCTKCSSSLPDWAQQCQFCGSDVRNAARVNNQPPARQFSSAAFVVPKGVWIAYYCISAYFVLSGIGQIMIGALAKEPNVIAMIFGGIMVVLGLGLSARVELVRGIVNFVCGLNIIFGLLGLATTLMTLGFFGPIGFLFVIKGAIDILTNALMIYLIGETEKGMPNL